MSDWTITASEGLPVIGDTDTPETPVRAAALLIHGFKGYKDYGMFPVLARALAARGVLCHRFNLAHSGMTDRIETFERPDLFERDTWKFQAEDVARVASAVAAGELPGRGLPLFIIGHSRGGTTAILTGAHHAHEIDGLAGIVTINAPASCCSLSDEDRTRLLRDGYLDSPSARTRQTLRVGRAWLQSQIDDPAWHDVLAAAAALRAPALVLHGDKDSTVPPSAGEQIFDSVSTHKLLRVIEGADHVLNTPNPAENAPVSPQLAFAIDQIDAFMSEQVGARSR